MAVLVRAVCSTEAPCFCLDGYKYALPLESSMDWRE